MSDILSGDELLELFVFETEQLIEQLEILLIDAEKEQEYNEDAINEIFRIMHTIKGSAALMQFDNISTLAHKIEDLFFFVREGNSVGDNFGDLSDLLLSCTDFMKVEIEKIKESETPDGDSEELKKSLIDFLAMLKGNARDSGSSDASKPSVDNVVKENDNKKDVVEEVASDDCLMGGKNKYKCEVYFVDDCMMSNIKAFTIVNNLESKNAKLEYIPSDILENEESGAYILANGFKLNIETDCEYDEVNNIISQTSDLKTFKVHQVDSFDESPNEKMVVNEEKESDHAKKESKKENKPSKVDSKSDNKNKQHKDNANSMISVNIAKLDKLMDLVGELVMSQGMVFQNPDLEGLEIDGFRKAARQVEKITDELQDSVMSIRMVPLAPTFMKMNRITRDMSRKLNKDVELEIIGEDTEIDKSIIEHISDPLMHLIRNAVDHGIESKEERIAKGKDSKGKVILEGRNSSNEVLIIVKDNGQGLDREKLLKKARENGLLTKSEDEMTDKEVYSLILAPGFSCKDVVTEYSGRGVGMDVVAQNIASVNGSIEIDSVFGEGTTMTMKIPLTLAIIGGMNVRVGKSRYTIPTTTIKESFKPNSKDFVKDLSGNDMIMVRGECYPVVRIHEYYGVETEITDLQDGIMVMVENEKESVCIFVDELLGGQQIVVKSLPGYMKKLKGISGCTILGDGNVSLILDVAAIIRDFT